MEKGALGAARLNRIKSYFFVAPVYHFMELISMCTNPILMFHDGYNVDVETGEYSRRLYYCGFLRTLALFKPDFYSRIFLSVNSTILRPEFQDKYLIVPCGTCDACLSMRRREWAARCVFEAQVSTSNCFVTLTYDDEHLPADYGLHKEHLQLFWKRLRKNTGVKLRYFACGEYGELYSRPHYHAIIFGYKPSDPELYTVRSGNNLYLSQELSYNWKNGFVSVGDVTFESCSYVAGYVMKKLHDRSDYQGREPPFVVMSRRPGIGYDWYQRYKSDVFPNDFVVVRDSIKLRPPRFFEKVYEREFIPHKDILLDDIKHKRLDNLKFKQIRSPTEFTIARLCEKELYNSLKKKECVRDYEV